MPLDISVAKFQRWKKRVSAGICEEALDLQASAPPAVESSSEKLDRCSRAAQI